MPSFMSIGQLHKSFTIKSADIHKINTNNNTNNNTSNTNTISEDKEG